MSREHGTYDVCGDGGATLTAAPDLRFIQARREGRPGRSPGASSRGNRSRSDCRDESERESESDSSGSPGGLPSRGMGAKRPSGAFEPRVSEVRAAARFRTARGTEAVSQAPQARGPRLAHRRGARCLRRARGVRHRLAAGGAHGAAEERGGGDRGGAVRGAVALTTRPVSRSPSRAASARPIHSSPSHPRALPSPGCQRGGRRC